MAEKLSDSVYWRMVDRYVDVTQWTTARKVALMMMLALPFHVGFGIFSHVVLREAGGTIRREAFDAVQAIWLLAIGVVMGLAWWAGRKGRDAPWTAILLIVGYGTPIALMLHVTGTWGSPFIAFYPLALMLVTLFVGPRAGVMAFAYGTLLLSVLTALEMTAVLPYASVFIDRSLEAQATPAWVTSQAGFILIVFVYYVAVLGFAAAARERAQQRLEAAHAELTEARVHLERANYLVSRYVAAQVAKHIRDGDYETICSHSRRPLTIFFSDVVGFTRIADAMEPEDLSRILNEYLSEMCAIAESHGATVDKFIGDAVMAFFGAPEISDDRSDALRAVRMAVAMSRQLVELRAKWREEGFDEPWEIRIGINMGQASVGEFGSEHRVDYTAIGRQVNLAARLQAAAEPGEILMSHRMWLLVRDEIACVPRGEIRMKGFAEPVEVYAVDQDAIETTKAGSPLPVPPARSRP